MILLALLFVFGRKISCEKDVFYHQISDVNNRLNQIADIVVDHMEDIVLFIDEKDAKTLENNELIKQEIIDNISEFKLIAENNRMKSEEEITAKCQEFEKRFDKIYKGNEAVRQNMSTIEEIFRLQLVNGLLDDADKLITNY